MAIPIPLQEALRDSITSGTFVDTKFWVFSKRSSKTGRVVKPKALFINGHVAKRVPRLVSLLDARETKENLRVRFPTDRRSYANDYDYEDDSDLEEDGEDDEDDISDDEPADAPHVPTEKPRNNSDAVGIEASDLKSNESDTLSISDLDSFSEPSNTKGEAGTTSSAHVGKVVVIEDVAFVTFQALLRYLYTDEIEFAAWGSTERRKARSLEKISESYGIPKPSPKSIYRLADKYDIPALKELALRQIRQDLSKCDIVEEVVSKYTSWYPELRELELKQLARVLLSDDSGPTLVALRTKVKGYAGGQLRHAEHVFPAIYELMENDGPIEETPLPLPVSSNQQVTGVDWDGLKKALTSSLTSGTFLDSQFYAAESRSSTGSPKIRPVYFCSTVGGSFASKPLALSSKLRARREPLPRFEDGYDSDLSDEEPDLESSKERYPCSKCIRENPTPADLPMEPALLLKSGAAKTWSAIFLYVYTGQVAFTTIGSQDVASSETKNTQNGNSQEEKSPPQGSGGTVVPPPGAIVLEPCSPKSIYSLAKKVGLSGLRDIAFKSIQSQLGENNIVQELFSPFTANHKRIREMEHELFQSKLKPSVDGALLSDIIRSCSSGEHSHRTAAMELILERSIQGRRERASKKVKDSLQPDPTPEPKRNEPLKTTSQPAERPAPPLASQPPPQPLSSTIARILVSTLIAREAPQNPPPLQKPAKSTKTGAQHEEPRPNTMVNASPSEDVVQLACSWCNVKQLRSHLRSGVDCRFCPGSFVGMKCVGCGTMRVSDIEACSNCHKKFK